MFNVLIIGYAVVYISLSAPPKPSELPKHFKGLQVIYLPLTLPMLSLS